MKIKYVAGNLIIRETPIVLWIIGLFFAGVGGIIAYGALGGFTDYKDYSFATLILIFLMGASAIATGFWIIYQAPISKVTINHIENFVSLKRYGLFGKYENIYRFDQVRRFCLVEEKDDDDQPVWSLGMQLENGKKIKITSMPSHCEKRWRQYVFQTNQFMRKQFSPAQIILAAGDETDVEMS